METIPITPYVGTTITIKMMEDGILVEKIVTPEELIKLIK